MPRRGTARSLATPCPTFGGTARYCPASARFYLLLDAFQCSGCFPSSWPCPLSSKGFSWAVWTPLLLALLLTPTSQHQLPFSGHTHPLGAGLDSGLEGPYPCRCQGAGRRPRPRTRPVAQWERLSDSCRGLGKPGAQGRCRDVVESSPQSAGLPDGSCTVSAAPDAGCVC